MPCVTRKDAKKLADNPICFAMMLDDIELQNVIAVFVSALNKEKPNRGG